MRVCLAGHSAVRWSTVCGQVLGYEVTPSGISIDPSKEEAIRDWPLPVDGKAVMRFLGADNFNR